MALGRTITELQSSMPMSEYYTWLAYRRKNGPMSLQRMYDSGSAIVASQVNNAFGGKARAKDFMPYQQEPQIDLGDDAAIELLAKGSQARIGR